MFYMLTKNEYDITRYIKIRLIENDMKVKDLAKAMSISERTASRYINHPHDIKVIDLVNRVNWRSV